MITTDGGLNVQERTNRRADSDSDLCIEDCNTSTSNHEGDQQRRSSVGRVSIRLVSDSHLATYKTRD